MKYLLLFFAFSMPFFLCSQTLYFDEEGVRLNVEIKNTGQSVICTNDWDKNYTDEPLHIWKVTLSFRNGSDKVVVPKLMGIASINMEPSDGKYLDYCGYKPLFEHGVRDAGAHLFGFIIFNNQGKSVGAGKTVSHSAHLYLLPGTKPILAEWKFPGYTFLDGSPNPELVVNGKSEEAEEIRFKSINSDKVGKEEEEVKSHYDVNDIDDIVNSNIGLADIKVDTSRVNLKAIEKAVEGNPDYYDELTACMESGNAKYYRDKLENISPSNLNSMQAYSWLSVFYSYQCECEVGSTRPEQLVKDMNQLVETFNSSTKNTTFAPLKKVYNCKKIESNFKVENTTSDTGNSGQSNFNAQRSPETATARAVVSTESQSNENIIDNVTKELRLRDDEIEAVKIISSSKNSNEALARLQERNIQKLNNYTLDALNKLTDKIPDFPLTGGEIQTLINGGSFKEVLKNHNLRASSKIAQDLGLDYNQTQALNIIATSENKEEMVERLKQNNIQQVSQKAAEGLQRMLGDSYSSLPITSGDISEMLNGNFEGALTNIKYNQDINSISRLTGGDTELAADLYNVASAIGEELNRPKTPEELERMFKAKLKLKRSVDYNTSANESITMYSYGNQRHVSYYKFTELSDGQFSNYLRSIYKSEIYDSGGNLLSNIIYNSDKEQVMTDFVNNKKIKSLFDEEGQVKMMIDLNSKKVIFDATKNEVEIIKDKKGRIIGEKTYNNGVLRQEKIINSKTNELIIYQDNGKKYSHAYYYNKGIRKLLFYKNIIYDSKGDIKLIQEHKKIKERIDTEYNQGIPIIKKVYKNGILESEMPIK